MLNKMLETLDVIVESKTGRSVLVGLMAIFLFSVLAGWALFACSMFVGMLQLLYVCSRLPEGYLNLELGELDRRLGFLQDDRRLPPAPAPMPAPRIILLPPPPVPAPRIEANLENVGFFARMWSLVKPVKKVSIPERPKTFLERLDAIHYEGDIPDNLCCPVSLQIMNDPITLPSTGRTYDRASLQDLAARMPGELKCPITQKPFDRTHIEYTATNYDKKDDIEKFVASKEKEYKERAAPAGILSAGARPGLFAKPPARTAAAPSEAASSDLRARR